jgi:hypothetical protein
MPGVQVAFVERCFDDLHGLCRVVPDLERDVVDTSRLEDRVPAKQLLTAIQLTSTAAFIASLCSGC